MQAPPTYVPALTSPDFTPPFTLLLHHYQPNARFHLARSQVQGKAIKAAYQVFPPYITVNQDLAKPDFAVGQRVAVCTTDGYAYLAARYRLSEVAQAKNCKLLTVTAPAPAD